MKRAYVPKKLKRVLVSETKLRSRMLAATGRGEGAHAKSFEDESKVVSRYARMRDGARRAGRLNEFDLALGKLLRRRDREELGGYVSRDDLLGPLETFALSSSSYVKATQPHLTEDEARSKANHARRQSYSVIVSEGDELIGDAVERVHRVEESRGKRGYWGQLFAKRRTLEVGVGDVEGNPLDVDRNGKMVRLKYEPKEVGKAKLRAYQSRVEGDEIERIRGEKEADYLAKAKAEGRRESKRDLLREAGIEISITSDDEEEAAQRAYGRRVALQKHMSVGARAGRAGRVLASPLAPVTVGVRGWWLKQREKQLRAQLDAGDLTSEHKARLERDLVGVVERNPWNKMGVERWGAFAKLVSVKSWMWFSLGVFLMVATMWQVLGVAAMQALLVGFAGVLNVAVITVVNGVITGVVVVSGAIANFMLGITSGVVGWTYDSIWSSALRFIPSAEYVKPTLGLASVTVPQLSYLGVMMDVTTAEDGVVDYGLPGFVFLDAKGNLVPEFGWMSQGAGNGGLPFELSWGQVRTCSSDEFECEKSSPGEFIGDVALSAWQRTQLGLLEGVEWAKSLVGG